MAHRFILQMDCINAIWKGSRDRSCHTGVWYWVCPKQKAVLGNGGRRKKWTSDINHNFSKWYVCQFPFKINEHWKPLYPGVDHYLIFAIQFCYSGSFEKKWYDTLILCSVYLWKKRPKWFILSVSLAISLCSLSLGQKYYWFALFMFKTHLSQSLDI